MNTPAYIVTDNSITIVVNGKPYTTTVGQANFNEVKGRISKNDFRNIESLFDTGVAITSYSKGKLEIKNNAVYYKGQIVHNYLVDRILQFMREGLPYKPLTNFLENLLQNPSFRAVNELYSFLEKSNLPITEDGHFLAYRKVTHDYKDFYTRPFDNSVGKTVEIPRNLVDEDKNNTCSYGLHFCSQSYLSHYHGGDGKVVIVKINPADVVAIPADYNNAKGRCCKYVVFADCENHDSGNSFGAFYSDKPVDDGVNYDSSDSSDDSDDSDLCRCESCVEGSFAEGYASGQKDAINGKTRDAEGAYEDFAFDDLLEDHFVSGYHAGFEENLNIDKLRIKVSKAKKAQKRDSYGRFA